MKNGKTKKFDLDDQLRNVADWSAYGVVSHAYKGGTGTKMPDCTTENPCLREGWLSFPGEGERPAYEYVSYTVSNGRRVLADGFDNPFHARLMAAAPEMLRFIKKIAEGDALALSVVSDATTLVKSIREPVHVPTYEDNTRDLNADDYPAMWHGLEGFGDDQ